MAKPATIANRLRTLTVLAYLVVGVLLLVCLYLAQTIFIPIAVAIFLAFLLSPLVTRLERWHLPRMAAVLLAVSFAALVLAAIMWLLTTQLQHLMEELPAHTQNLEERIRSVQRMNKGLPTERLARLLDEIMGEPPAAEQPSKGAEIKEKDDAEKPTTVIVSNRRSMLSWLASILPSVAGSLGRGGLAFVLALFILLNRGDMRNRVIRLAGHGHIPLTTKVVEEAGERVSRFLIMQLIVNASFGVVAAIGLAAIGVKYAILWGFLAGLLRYIPYIGVWIAALGPLLLSLGQSTGWVQPVLVLSLFVVAEIIAFNLIEPLYYSQGIGVSALALLVMAAFWAFLWGPIGMVLSSPLTVCLVVLGKYVPSLKFLDVLFGEEMPLDPKRSFYQRLLAHDQEEAMELIEERLKESTVEDVYENLLIPALMFARRDLLERRVSPALEESVFHGVRDIATQLVECTPPHNESRADWPRRARILGCPARDEADEIALTLLKNTLDPKRWELEIVSTDKLASELVQKVADEEPDLIYISSLAPGGLSHTRYLCKRLRARYPQVTILIGRLGLRGHRIATLEQLHDAGADVVTTTLLETRTQVDAWFPVMSEDVNNRVSAHSVQSATST